MRPAYPVPTCPCTPCRTSRGSLSRSTSDRARRSAGNDPQTCSTQRSQPADPRRLRERAVRGASIRGRGRVAGMIVVLHGSPGPGERALRRARAGRGNVNGVVKGARLVDGIAPSCAEKGPCVQHGTFHRARQRAPLRGSTASYPRADLIDGDLTSMLDSDSSRADVGLSAPSARSRSEARTGNRDRAFRRVSQLRSERPLLRR